MTSGTLVHYVCKTGLSRKSYLKYGVSILCLGIRNVRKTVGRISIFFTARAFLSFLREQSSRFLLNVTIDK